MPNTVNDKGAKFKEQRTYKKKLYNWFAALALVVVTGTLWMLAQPANTLSGQLICGIEEHSHTEDCYELQLVCNQDESEAHTHTEECRVNVPVCSKPEHAHIVECYDVTEPANGAEGQPEPLPEETTEPTDEPVPDEESLMSDEQTALPEQMRNDIPADYTEVRTARLPEGGAVYVLAQPGVIPEQVELRVRSVDETEEVFAQAEQRVKDAGVAYDYLTALDIALVDETGAEVEPSAPVYVSMDAGALLPEKADPETIRIQHHKELLPSEQGEWDRNEAVYAAEVPEVVVESVLDDTVGTLTYIEHTGTYAVTFLTEGFSIYTVTSEGWPDLKIRIECVDEYGRELPDTDKPNDVVFDKNYRPDEKFDILFMTDKTNNPAIEGYQYEGHAYFMRNGEYESRIYGLRRENNKWYYYTKDNEKNQKTEFSPPPNFKVIDEMDPPDFIRLLYKKVSDIPVQYVYDPGQYGGEETTLRPEDAPNGTNPANITYTGSVLDTSDTAAMPSSETCFFVGKAYLGDPSSSNDVVRVIRENGSLYGVTPEGAKLPISEESPLKLIYQKKQTGTPDVVKTVSTGDKGMTINLFDYNSDKSPSINDGHKLQFVGEGIGSKEKEYNRWTGKNGGIYTGIVADTLEEGYPTVDGESLAYLFDPEECRKQLNKQVDHLHTDLDGLFQLDRDGYYYYDSMKNFATIMDPNAEGGGHHPGHTDGGNFTVYQQAALPGDIGAKFLPFNTYAEASKSDNTGKDYHFGMTMEADFVMPPGGKIPDASGAHTGLRDMIFEFNGDDDVWVFIDNKLVLDLGGIHGRYGGTINFRTGEVTTNAPPARHSGWRQENLYGIDNPNKMTEDELKAAREKAGFGKYTQHNFKFFYLERGKGASNCEIRFNLAPVEHDLLIGKRIPEDMGGAATEHMWYQFQVETEYNEKKVPLANATYRRIQWTPESHPITGGHSIDVGQTNEEGRFWLRAGERADFSGAIDLKNAGIGENDSLKIYVSEILPDGTTAPQVIAWSGKEETEKTYLEILEANGETRKVAPPLYDSAGGPDFPEVKFHTENTKVSTELKKLEDTGETVCQAVLTTGRHNEFNWIDFENDLGAMSSLNIKKQARHSDGVTPLSGVPFAIKVELWDTKDKEWIPLAVGSECWILDSGEKPQADNKLRLEEAANGLISIQDGQTIYLHMLPGTKYRVSEVLSSEEKAVYTTTYEGRIRETDEQLEVFEDAGKQSGIENKAGIAAGSQHDITITNTGDPILTPNGSFVLQKQTQGVIPPDTKFQFNLRIQDYFTDATTGGYQPELSCTATYYGYPEGAYPGDPKHGWKETLVFKPTVTSEGTRGESYESNLFLCPGEIVVIEGLPNGKSLRVQEVFEAEQTGQYQVSFREEGKEPVVGTEIAKTAPIDSNSVVKVTCENQSNLQGSSALRLSKKVVRTDQPDGKPLPEDMSKPFAFRITLKNTAAFSQDQISATITAADGQSTEVALEFEPEGENYAANINLKHGETLLVSGLPVDGQAVVQELDHAGYVVTMNGVSGDCMTVDLRYNTGDPYEVECMNTTGVEIPETGGTGILPYILLGTLMMSAAGLLLYRQREKSRRA